MYFVIILAFAIVLSEDLPPPQLNLLSRGFFNVSDPYAATLGWVLAQVLLIPALALLLRRRVNHAFGVPGGADLAAQRFARGQLALLVLLAGALLVTNLCLPWSPIVRTRWGLNEIPLIGDLMLLAPFLATLTLVWIVQFPVERRLRGAALPAHEAPAPDSEVARASLLSERTDGPDASLGQYLLDKFRHHVFIIAAPMTAIVLAKHFTDLAREPLRLRTGLVWLSDALLGIVSIGVLVASPVMLRYIWSTTPLPPGPLRDRFDRTCRRIGLRHREILLWHTHGMAVNAAVMGFVPQLRYILVSDALLETLNEEQVEAVFAHEAGHIHHWHLPFFGAFAATSMYLSGGVMLLLDSSRLVTGAAMLQMAGMSVLLAAWLFGFGWLSRRFERQADLFGVRCLAPDVTNCLAWCPVHGERPTPGLCVSAANLFGRTLLQIARLNGIPRRAPSWRHGSIESRCRLIERLAADPIALGRFDRKIFTIKAALAALTVIGSFGAGVIYYQDIVRALSWRLASAPA